MACLQKLVLIVSVVFFFHRFRVWQVRPTGNLESHEYASNVVDKVMDALFFEITNTLLKLLLTLTVQVQ